MFVREMPVTEQPMYRAQTFGLSALSTPEVLQLITCAKRMEQVNELYEMCGGDLSQLGDMQIEEICEIGGFGEKTAIAIQAAFELGRRQLLSSEDFPQVRSPADAANLLMCDIGQEQQEHFVVMLLNTKNRVIGKEVVYKGTIDSAPIRAAEVFRSAVRRNARSVILAHNHPSGDPTPSPEDVQVTKQLVKAGKIMGIDILDHIIVGSHCYTSLNQQGLGF